MLTRYPPVRDAMGESALVGARKNNEEPGWRALHVDSLGLVTLR